MAPFESFRWTSRADARSWVLDFLHDARPDEPGVAASAGLLVRWAVPACEPLLRRFVADRRFTLEARSTLLEALVHTGAAPGRETVTLLDDLAASFGDEDVHPWPGWMLGDTLIVCCEHGAAELAHDAVARFGPSVRARILASLSGRPAPREGSAYDDLLEALYRRWLRDDRPQLEREVPDASPPILRHPHNLDVLAATVGRWILRAALGCIADEPREEDRGFLQWALEHAPASMRHLAVSGLGRLGERGLVWERCLRELARDGDEHQRWVAEGLLTRIGDAPAVARLRARAFERIGMGDLADLAAHDPRAHLDVFRHALEARDPGCGCEACRWALEVPIEAVAAFGSDDDRTTIVRNVLRFDAPSVGTFAAEKIDLRDGVASR